MAPGADPESSQKHHKILVLATADPQTAMLIRRARRMSDFLRRECFAVAVQPSGDLTPYAGGRAGGVERHLNFARNLHIETRILEGEDVARTLVDFARRNQITQIYLARPSRAVPRAVACRASLVQKIVGLAKDMQIVIVSERDPARD